ncbi:MAG: orotate phosphoribosyltransferase [Saprospiraceae bacterium]
MDLTNQIAQKLLQINAIQINIQNLFVWASGIKSPIYCDNRIALSYPEVRNLILEGFINASNNIDNYDVIAGVATAGIPWGALLADKLNKPFIYIRSQSKDHGKKNKIEGELKKGSKVLVIEDLISTGGSSIKAVESIRELDCEVIAVLAIFQYNLHQAKINFEKINCNFKTLSNFDVLIF